MISGNTAAETQERPTRSGLWEKSRRHHACRRLHQMHSGGPDGTSDLRCIAPGNAETVDGVCCGRNDSRPQLPVLLRLPRRKGIAATAGLIISFDWRITLVCAALFFLNLAVTHYVSLGSMMVYVVFFAMAVIMGQAGCFALEPPYLYEMYVVIALLAVLAFWEHRANIKRLIAGTERKTYLSKKSEK